MASDVIDLISSSPVRTTTSRPSACLQQPAKRRDDIDDFDDLDDDVFDVLDDRQAKRKRTTGPDDAQTNCDKLTTAISSKPPLPLKEQTSRYQNPTVLDPIEFTSSLEPVSPAKEQIDRGLPSQTSVAKKTIGNSTCEDAISCFSSDPFASSPHPLPGRPLASKRAVSLDPFCSSPPPSLTASRSRNTSTEYGKGRDGLRWQAGISRQSAIEVHEDVDTSLFADPQLPRWANGPVGLEGLITIDDSDSLSDDANDALPAISDMDVSKRRARSPLRRSQSDLTWSKSRTSYSATSTKRVKPQKTAHEREVEKTKKRLEREEAKAAKAAEKHRAAALVEVNKLRTDKKVSTPEMIVDLPSGLSSELRIQVQEMLQGLGVDHATWDCPKHSIIKWRRKVTSKYNDDIGLWEPVPARIVDEGIAMIIVTAEEVVAMALGDLLASHVADIKAHHGSMKFVYLVQGMTPWLRQNRNNRNRHFASGVRSTDAAASSSSRTNNAEYIPEDTVEDAMLALQVEHGMLIHHTAVAIDTARWVINFTQHVSTIPYRMQRDQATSVAGFCMESGQVRTGDSAHDTYVRTLQQVVRVTAPIAYGIAAEFDSITKLVQGLERGGPERLDSVRKSANKDGAVSDRTLGQAISRRMYKVFTGKDEDSTDV
ncbi:hypothetical protein X797_008393 [Metarhizium robertsii]|uniref:ERCC4 domain-containing protein n=2 Tax=Metarhizium robertsii TaxID=568076 RepID=E9F7Q2_METRA|nr:ERCC4 domain-containing protein [Metarhizium robertsii ARSEF 23]EFY96190.1 ERCC4 domain-containing protein [Metarhizium robertsii ARSEF 23]EXU98446.1 hypothetical protein X797_008393 [Metarhizium robertsii]